MATFFYLLFKRKAGRWRRRLISQIACVSGPEWPVHVKQNWEILESKDFDALDGCVPGWHVVYESNDWQAA